ncbi:MAG: hypothetical protein RLZZ01_971 [Actinomycetota bacterium]
MRAMVLTAHVPEWADGDTVRDPLASVDRPVPEPVEPFDVVVRVAAAGVCRTDLHLVTGAMATEFPRVLGHETAGVVHTVGSAVRAVRPGDSVVCYPFISSGRSSAERAGLDSAAPDRITPGITADGGFAEYLLTHERAMLTVPAGTDLTAVAPLTDAGLAAYRACARARPLLGPGSSVLVIGAGGLGHLAIQILRSTTPARIIAVDPGDRQRRLATDCGADETIPPDRAERDASTGELSVDVAIDFVGVDGTAALGVRATRFGGAFFAVGVGGRLDIGLDELVETEKRIEGVFVGTYTDLEEVTRLTLDGLVTPHVTIYPLTAANDALRDLAAGRVTGRAVLVP